MTLDGLAVDLLIRGVLDQNRAIHDDTVYLQVQPIKRWFTMNSVKAAMAGSDRCAAAQAVAAAAGACPQQAAPALAAHSERCVLWSPFQRLLCFLCCGSAWSTIKSSQLEASLKPA